MTLQVAGQRPRPAVGGEIAFARLATRPCVGTLGSSSRASSHRASFYHRRARGVMAKGDPSLTRPLIPTRPLFTGIVPPPRPRAHEARGSPFTRARPLRRPRVQAARGAVGGDSQKARAVERAHTLAEGSTADTQATYSEATSGAALSAQFQESVPEGQAKGAPPEKPPSTTGGADGLGGAVSAMGYMPTAVSQLTPAEVEEDRRIAEEFNAFLDAFLAPQPKPVAPKPAPTASAWEPQLPTRPPMGRAAGILPAVHTEQGEASAPAEAAEPGDDLAPSVGADGEPATVGSYPPYHKPAAVIVLGRTPPPPPLRLLWRAST